MCRLTSADVVRHPLVARVVDAYDAPGRIGILRRDDAEPLVAKRPARSLKRSDL
jgi:hypothetical protein